jgi:SAM-dependent methyltransferase
MTPQKRQKAKKPSLAEQADRHHLYELSVQNAESEVDFIDDIYKALRGRRAKQLREDFCGTANVCCEWVRRRKGNHAIGVDIDPEVLGWGQTNNLSRLPAAAQKRIELLQQNVLKAKTPPSDAIIAMNFSYWLFKTRKGLKQYFRQAHRALADDGILFLDAYGGYDSFREIKEKTRHDDKGFTYIWEQAKYEPISGELSCHIHFAFPDGSCLKKAFSYDWRLWTLPELRELLTEAGFGKATVYWQGFDEEGEPDGIFKPTTQGEADAGWICYLTAEK